MSTASDSNQRIPFSLPAHLVPFRREIQQLCDLPLPVAQWVFRQLAEVRRETADVGVGSALVAVRFILMPPEVKQALLEADAAWLDETDDDEGDLVAM